MNKLYFREDLQWFSLEICKAWNGKSGGVMLRASVNAWINERRYQLKYALFAEWDYQNAQQAFEQAKIWLGEQTESMEAELAASHQMIMQGEE